MEFVEANVGNTVVIFNNLVKGEITFWLIAIKASKLRFQAELTG
jgi:hypothetical protein